MVVVWTKTFIWDIKVSHVSIVNNKIKINSELSSSIMASLHIHLLIVRIRIKGEGLRVKGLIDRFLFLFFK